MKLLIKFPTRQRKNLFFSTLGKYISMASGKHEIEFVISMDENDEIMNTPEVREKIDDLAAGGSDIKYFYGQSATKIEAINADMDKASNNWDMILPEISVCFS
jgi:hypothetical protein